MNAVPKKDDHVQQCGDYKVTIINTALDVDQKFNVFIAGARSYRCNLVWRKKTFKT